MYCFIYLFIETLLKHEGLEGTELLVNTCGTGLFLSTFSCTN